MNNLIPYFEISGKDSYPDDYRLFSEMLEVMFNDSKYWACQYNGDLDLETGADKYVDYEASLVVEPIIVTVDLSEAQCKLGTEVHYTITFSQPITVPFVVPISVSDRNGNHITNIGCNVVDGVATGYFTMAVAGDFTVTDEAINYHHTVITAPLKLAEQPWLRVYQ